MTVVHDNLEKTEAKMRAEAVSVFYGDKKAIDEVSIDIPTEYVTAFIGPSGCGKSTFLRTLNRMNDTIPTARVEGSIQLDGEDIYASGMDVVQLRARVGMVFQKPNPFPKSIYDNIAYGPKIHGLAEGKDELDAIVEKSLRRAGLWEEVKERLQDSGTALSTEERAEAEGLVDLAEALSLLKLMTRISSRLRRSVRRGTRQSAGVVLRGCSRQMVVVRMFTSLNVIVDSRMNRTLKAFQSKAWGRDEVAHPRIVNRATCNVR